MLGRCLPFNFLTIVLMENSNRSAAALFGGLIVGIIGVMFSYAYAVLVFGGPLATFLGPGIGMMLISVVMLAVVNSLLSSTPSTIAVPQYRIIPLFAIMAGAITASMSRASGLEKFATVVVAIHIATCITGLVFLLLGRHKVSGMMRYIPTPVVGGFLAGNGWLLVKGSIPVLTGYPSGAWSSSLLFSQPDVFRWMPGVIVALVILIISRRHRN